MIKRILVITLILATIITCIVTTYLAIENDIGIWVVASSNCLFWLIALEIFIRLVDKFDLK